MQSISPFKHHRTSLTLRESSYRRARAAVLILRRAGIRWSESRLFEELGKVYLSRWRGEGKKSATLRRYNARIKAKTYVVRPWYVNQVLYSALVQRGLHSGQSVSRMIDFALRYFLYTYLASLLRSPMPRCARAARNAPYWAKIYESRRHKCPPVFISYSCKTRKNSGGNLEYLQKLRIIPKTGLTPSQILDVMRYAA
jgi:hypothetical protein